ncbi:MAG: 4-alpha-glucanotransferase [Leptolyngbyaceae bacterium]|nr:4-alpha-glucanotransferase [Leptolyngbyaceae bacterium]
MPFPRSSGILLHPTSFPGPFGVGDVGSAAYRFIDFLQRSKQTIWQVLPLGPTGHGNSPYMCYSSMAGNHILISLEMLVEQGLLAQADIERDRPDFPTHCADYDRAIPYKLNLLTQAAQNFAANATAAQKSAFDAFCRDRQDWLDDYALFMALKQANGGKPWTQWDQSLVKRKPEALDYWRQQLGDTIFQHQFWQFEFFNQWSALKKYANERDVIIFGDMPIYVAHDSADVWEAPDIFQLNPETGEPAWMAGVPPDYFSETGQLWGNPIYNWEKIQQDDFKWWVRRFKGLLDYVDILRIDHFRGFEAFWQIPYGEETAINGHWVGAPGHQLFEKIGTELGKLPIVAEDLGIITPEVEHLRDRFEFPGMKILHFAFGGDDGNPYLPHNHVENCIVYTGTHDNDTSIGWFHQLPDWERDKLMGYIGGIDQDSIHWKMVHLAFSSVANQVIVPLQDLFGLGSDCRMNTPGKPSGNWTWRYEESQLTPEVGDRLANLTSQHNRECSPVTL